MIGRHQRRCQRTPDQRGSAQPLPSKPFAVVIVIRFRGPQYLSGTFMSLLSAAPEQSVKPSQRFIARTMHVRLPRLPTVIRSRVNVPVAVRADVRIELRSQLRAVSPGHLLDDLCTQRKGNGDHGRSAQTRQQREMAVSSMSTAASRRP
jgi:hypothetical protein